VNPLKECHLRTHQTLRRHTGIYARVYYPVKHCIPPGVGRTMCHAEEYETLYRSFIRASVETDCDRAASSLLSRRQQKNQDRLKEAVNSMDFSHSSRKAWRIINKLTGRSGRSSCLWIASPPGWSTRNCPTYGRPQHLRVTVSLNPFGRRNLLLPSDAWSQETLLSLRDWIPSSRISYPMPGWVSSHGFAIFSLPACANTRLKRSGE